MIIRFANDSDLDKIADLYVYNHKTTYRNLLSEEYLNSLSIESAKNRWQSYLEKGDKIWVAYESDIFLGFTAGKEDDLIDNTWHLDSLHVCENARGRGIGTELIRYMGRYAKENGYGSMSVCVVKGNETAKSLYIRLGAVPYENFEDNFSNTRANSEKLLWKEINFI